MNNQVFVKGNIRKARVLKERYARKKNRENWDLPLPDFIKDAASATVDFVEDTADDVVDFVEDTADDIVDNVEVAAGVVMEVGDSIGNFVVSETGQFIDEATGFAVSVGQTVGEGVHTFVVRADGLYQDARGAIHRIGDAIGNYALDVTGKVVNAYGEAWDSVENAARKTADVLESGIEDVGNGLHRVGDFIVDETGKIIDAVGSAVTDAWKALMNEFMDLMCNHAGALAGGATVAGVITGVAGCATSATAISAAIIFLGGGPENPVADSIAATVSTLFLVLCVAGVEAKGIYNMPEMAGDIQVNSCRNMPTINWMRNSLLKDARKWAYYDPVFNWIPDWIKDGLCDYATPICMASGFSDVATGAGDCIEKGGEAAAAIAVMTGGAFDPAGDMAGIMLGGAIGGTCIAGLEASTIYGMDHCVGDMQISYCPVDANQRSIIPSGNEDKTMYSQYSRVPLSNEEMDAGQEAARTDPNYYRALNQARGLGSAYRAGWNAATPSALEMRAGTVETGLTPVFNAEKIYNAKRGYDRTHGGTNYSWTSRQNQHPINTGVPFSLQNCANTRDLQTAKSTCSSTSDCDGFWRYTSGGSSGRTCYKKAPFTGGYRNAADGTFYELTRN